MKTPSKTLRTLLDFLMVIVGDCIYSLFVQLFVVPGDLLTGGTTGVGLTVERLFGIPASAVVLAINTLLFVLAWLLLGKRFAMTALISTFVCPLSLGLFERLLDGVVLTADPLLCTLFGGLGIGLGLGIVVRTGSSTGGMDIPPYLMNKYLHIPLGVGIYAVDVCILGMQMLHSNIELSLYGILLVFVYTITLSKVQMLGHSRTEVKIISNKSAEIRDAILFRLDRGVTTLQSVGGFSGEQGSVLLSVVSNRELPLVRKLVTEIDPACFMIVSRINEVQGRGFSMEKLTLEK